jgi:O-antigen ligase
LKKTFVLGGIFILPLFLIGFITGQPLFGEFTPLSTEGSRALAPSYAFYILIALITLIAYPDIFKTSGSDLNFRPQNFKRNFSFKRFLPLIIWFFVMAILLSLSRHLWLALILGIYLIWRYLVDSRQYILKDIYKPFVAAMVFFILLYLLFSFVLPSYFINLPNFLNDIKLRFESFFNPEDVSFNYRAALWKESLSYFFTNPLFGIGYGQEITFPVEGTILTAPIRELHNSLYAVLLQMGIVGFLPIFFIVIWCLLRFFRSPDKEKSAYSLTLLILFLFSSLFGTYLEINLLAIFFWIFLAIFKFQIITTRD